MRLRIMVSSSLALLFVIIAASGLSAQTGGPQGTPQTSASPATTPGPQPRPSAISSPGPEESNGAQPASSPAPSPRVTKVVEGHLELDDIIHLEVEGLGEWMNEETNDAKKLVPFINGRAITGNYPEAIDSSNNHIQFHLELTPENKDVWTDLLGAPAGAHRPVSL